MKLKAKVIIPIAVLVLVVGIGIGVGVHFLSSAREEVNNYNVRIPYAEGVLLMDDDTEIEPVEQGWIKLNYNHQAFSADGTNFACFLSNDPANVHDLFFSLYADAELTDELYLSGLLAPGSVLKDVSLSRALPTGSSTVFVVFNQVDTGEDGIQTIVGQSVITVEFIVSE